jgi:hypothetical protein
LRPPICGRDEHVGDHRTDVNAYLDRAGLSSKIAVVATPIRRKPQWMTRAY